MNRKPRRQPRYLFHERTPPAIGDWALKALTGHVRSFAQILTERQGKRLPEWLDAVRSDDLPGAQF